MRYAETHKQETRKRVVQAAAAAVRAKGPDGVGVAEIMGEVGLTHGGFYAHFPNKEALVVAAIEEAFGQSARRFARMLEGLDAAASLDAFVDAYVSMDHRANTSGGCPIATLSSDLPRQGPAIRAAYERGVRGLIGRLEGWLAEDRKRLAPSLLAEMAGAVSLSRAMSEDVAAERLLADARTSLKSRMGIAQ